MISLKGRVIAVDFDGTIVEHDYPKIGKQMLFAFATLKELEKKGHRLILWTYRTGDLLDEAVDYCRENGLVFYAVNESFPGETDEGNFGRKVNADIFIDDRNVGGFLGWERIWKTLHPDDGDFYHQLQNKEAHLNFPKSLKSIFHVFRK